MRLCLLFIFTFCLLQGSGQEGNFEASFQANQFEIKQIDFEGLCSQSASHSSYCISEPTSIHQASNRGFFYRVKTYIEGGCDVEMFDVLGQTPLHAAVATSAFHPDIIDLLLEKNASVNAVDSDGNTPLHLAVCFSPFITVAYLISVCNSAVDVANSRGLTPLHFAASRDRSRCCSYLISQGADINSIGGCDIYDSDIDELGRERFGATPAYYAVIKNDPETLDAFLFHMYHNLDISKIGPERQKAMLIAACQGGYDKIVQMLIDNNVSVNIYNDTVSIAKKGYTPLHIACEQKSYGIVRMLLSAGADTQAAIRLTPLDIAQDDKLLTFIFQSSKMKK